MCSSTYQTSAAVCFMHADDLFFSFYMPFKLNNWCFSAFRKKNRLSNVFRLLLLYSLLFYIMHVIHYYMLLLRLIQPCIYADNLQTISNRWKCQLWFDFVYSKGISKYCDKISFEKIRFFSIQYLHIL